MQVCGCREGCEAQAVCESSRRVSRSDRGRLPTIHWGMLLLHSYCNNVGTSQYVCEKLGAKQCSRVAGMLLRSNRCLWKVLCFYSIAIRCSLSTYVRLFCVWRLSFAFSLMYLTLYPCSSDRQVFSAEQERCPHAKYLGESIILSCDVHTVSLLWVRVIVKSMQFSLFMHTEWSPNSSGSWLQVKGQLSTVQKVDSQTESFARLDYHQECEAAINEQIK